MPCYDGRDSGSSYCYECSRIRKDLDHRTAQLCAVLTILDMIATGPDGSTPVSLMPEDVQLWWKTHKEFDAKRKQEGDDNE